jgi:hypothetical protein
MASSLDEDDRERKKAKSAAPAFSLLLEREWRLSDYVL